MMKNYKGQDFGKEIEKANGLKMKWYEDMIIEVGD